MLVKKWVNEANTSAKISKDFFYAAICPTLVIGPKLQKVDNARKEGVGGTIGKLQSWLKEGEDLDCKFLNNDQAFLNLCRDNHYQFDELRRAKHTSMMVFWHLHNQDAPKFVQQCVCNREMLSGKHYHCDTCPEYDLCEECYKDPKVNRGL